MQLRWLLLCSLMFASMGAPRAQAEDPSPPFRGGGDVGNLDWITPDSTRGAGRPRGPAISFPIRFLGQLGVGRVGPRENRLIDFSGMIEGYRPIPLSENARLEFGGLVGANLGIVSFDEGFVDARTWRLMLGAGPSATLHVVASPELALRPSLYLGPMVLGQRTSYDGPFGEYSDSDFEWGMTLRIALEAENRSWPVAVAIGHQRFGYGDGSAEDGLTFIAFRLFNRD